MVAIHVNLMNQSAHKSYEISMIPSNTMLEEVTDIHKKLCVLTALNQPFTSEDMACIQWMTNAN
jgi:hypothetical protein